jgi:CIC family chloride channel protein
VSAAEDGAPAKSRSFASGLHIRLPRPAAARGLAAQFRASVRSSEVLLVFTAAIIGCGAGAAVTVMSGLAQFAHVFFYKIALDQRLSGVDHITPWMAMTAPVIGGLAIGLIELWRRHSNARVAVDPVEANALHGGRMSLRDSLVVSLQTLISNGCGASVGLEAGYTQIGSGLASRLGIMLRLRRNDLRIVVGCGAAGAIAAAFGAPLTGAFYAFELIVGVYSVANVASVTTAALTGVLTATALGGAPYALNVAPVLAVKPLHYLPLMAIGLTAAVLGVAVMRATDLMDRAFRWTPLPSWARPAVGGIMIGALALVTPQVLAAGHGGMKLDLPLDLTMKRLAFLIALKLLAALVSLGSGFRGGLFFCSLFVGSLLGKLGGRICDHALHSWNVDPTACVLTGMGVFAVAVVGGPLTMSFLVLETTRDFSVTAPVLAACVVTSLAVRETFGYSFSTWRLHLRGETIRSAADIGWIRSLTVGKLMRRDPRTIPADATVAEFRRRYPLGSTHMVVVLDDHERYAGLAATPDLFTAELDEKADETKVGDLVHDRDIALLPEWNAKEALAVFDRAEAETLAVIESQDTGKVIGLLTERFATRRYAEELDKANRGVLGEE